MTKRQIEPILKRKVWRIWQTITGIRQKTIVQEGGRIEVPASDLPAGVTVEVLVFIDSEEQDTTEYLLSTEANRQHLFQALKALEDRSTYREVKFHVR